MSIDTYSVISKTSRVNEGFSDFCWMEIGVKKLCKAAATNQSYHFHCIIGGEEFAYSYPAVELKHLFEEKQVRIKGEKAPRYSFYIEYPTGTIFRNLSLKEREENLVCSLIPEKTDKQSTIVSAVSSNSGEYKADQNLQAALHASGCSHLPELVARTALWATKKEYDECLKKHSPAKYPKVCRKSSDKKRGKQGDMYYDDNSYPNAQMKASLKKRGIIPIGYETCHIWERTCYDPLYHTCYANLVLLPRALASLSDHDETVKAILKWYAYEKFDHFIPNECVMPDKPEIYEQIKHLFKDLE